MGGELDKARAALGEANVRADFHDGPFRRGSVDCAPHLRVALAEVDRLTAALAEAEAIPLRMILAAKGGASDYLGGHHDASSLDVFRHGMGTIVSVIEAAAKMDPTDYQTRANVAMGAALIATEKP